MSFRYRNTGLHDAEVDAKRCAASVSFGRIGIKQCARGCWRDGWCKQHHPDTEAKAESEREKRWKNKWEEITRNRAAGEQRLRDEGAKAALADVVAWLRAMPIGGTNEIIDGMLRAQQDHLIERLERGDHVGAASKKKRQKG